MKRVISVFVALTMIVSAFAFASTNASAVDYNPQSALDYAEKNWDNGIELCAGFGNEGIALVSKAVSGKASVGAVKFDYHPGFEFKSGDELFNQ